MNSLNVARLANVPKSVLEVAATKSKQLEEEDRAKGLASMYVSTAGGFFEPTF
jgi:DNA mismatch repair ATPase MutS